MIRAALISLVVLAGAAGAQELRPAPGYLTDMFAQVYAAEKLAQHCPSVTVDGARVQSGWLAVFARLEAEGFDMTREDGGMRDPSKAIDAAIVDWAEKRALTGATPVEALCRAAQIEMSEGSAVGKLLRKTTG